MNEDTYEPLLSGDCEEFLASLDCYGLQSVLRPDEVCIHDCDGDRVFTVTKSIDARDLKSAYFHGRTMYERGERGGRNGLQAALRDLLNVPQWEADA